jgi:hypothetical protein
VTIEQTRLKAREIFGETARVYSTKDTVKIGYLSSYGFHVRGSGETPEKAIESIRRNSDDPSPTSPGWLANLERGIR